METVKPIRVNIHVPLDRRHNITGTIFLNWYHLDVGDEVRVEVDEYAFECKVVDYDKRTNEYFVSGRNLIEYNVEWF